MRTRLIWGMWVVCVALSGSLVAAGCAPTPPTADPLIECQSLGGTVTYDPPASNAGVDVHLDVASAALDNCVDHSGHGISSGTLTGQFVLPNAVCGIAPAGTEIGTGAGTITWSNGVQSHYSSVLRSPGSLNQFILEITTTSGAWTGSTASVVLGVVSSIGNCVEVPVSEAVLESLQPFVLHPHD